MNSLMNWLIENWYLLVGVIVCLVVIYNIIRWFLKLPSSEQLKMIKTWLYQAVVEAELLLGSQTGKAKLSMVYDWFTDKFPWTSHLISLDKFEELVDEALEEVKDILDGINAVKEVEEVE